MDSGKMNIKEVAERLGHLEKKVLLALEGIPEASPEEIMERGGFEKLVEVMNGISWNQMKGLVSVEESASKVIFISGKEKVGVKLPERRLLESMMSGPGETSVDELKGTMILTDEETSAAVGWMKRKGWAEISKGADGSVKLKLTELGRAMYGKIGNDEKLLAVLISKKEVPEKECDPEAVKML